MDRKLLKTYWFDFNNTVNEKLPLTYDTLKICKIEIDKLILLNNDSIGSKQNPIKLELTFNQKYSSSEEIKEINLDMYEDSKNNSFFNNLTNHIFSYLNLIIQPLALIWELRLNYISSKLNLKHYYVINDVIYVTYKDSLLAFNSYNDYINDLKKINNVKYNFLYRNRIELNLNNIIDTLFIKSILFIHLNYLKLTHDNRLNYRLKQTDWGFYINNTNQSNLINIFSGIKYVWKGLRFWLIGLIIGLGAIYYLMYIRLLPFNKIVFSWILLSMFLYWLISGFVFFIKKYQYSRFTAAIQRFWKRTYIIFWLIEAGTFSVFFYLTLNSSSEPVYMYDQIRIFKNNLFSWRWFLIKLLPSVSIILLGYYLQISLKWNLFNNLIF